jgi:hypothetical protein
MKDAQAEMDEAVAEWLVAHQGFERYLPPHGTSTPSLLVHGGVATVPQRSWLFARLSFGIPGTRI